MNEEWKKKSYHADYYDEYDENEHDPIQEAFTIAEPYPELFLPLGDESLIAHKDDNTDQPICQPQDWFPQYNVLVSYILNLWVFIQFNKTL